MHGRLCGVRRGRASWRIEQIRHVCERDGIITIAATTTRLGLGRGLGRRRRGRNRQQGGRGVGELERARPRRGLDQIDELRLAQACAALVVELAHDVADFHALRLGGGGRIHAGDGDGTVGRPLG